MLDFVAWVIGGISVGVAGVMAGTLAEHRQLPILLSDVKANTMAALQSTYYAINTVKELRSKP